MQDERRICIELDRNFENLGTRLILPYLEDADLSEYLSKKLEKDCRFITYDSLSEMECCGYISIDGEYYNFNLDKYLEI